MLPLGLQEQQKKRDRSAQIADHRRVTNAMDRCSLCFASTSRARHLTISLGQSAYLALPARSDLVMHSLLDVVACKASTFLCGAKTSVSCYLSCVSQACLSLVIWKVGQPTLPSCMHTVVFAAFAFTCKQKSYQSRQFLSRIKPDTRLTLYKLPLKHGARDCLSV